MYRIGHKNIPTCSNPVCEIYNKEGKDSYCRKYYHNDNEPAVILEDGTQIYCFWGFIHRDDGPAIEYLDGRVDYFIFGEKVSEADFGWEIFLKGMGIWTIIR